MSKKIAASDTLEPADILKLTHGLLRIVGLLPGQHHLISKILSTFAVVSIGLNIFLALLELILHWEGVNTMLKFELLPANITVSNLLPYRNKFRSNNLF